MTLRDGAEPPKKRMMVSYPGLPSAAPHEESPECRAAGCTPLEQLKPAVVSEGAPQPMTMDVDFRKLAECIREPNLTTTGAARMVQEAAEVLAARRVASLEKQLRRADEAILQGAADDLERVKKLTNVIAELRAQLEAERAKHSPK